MAISRRREMPKKPILFFEFFYVWGIDFMGPFLVSHGYFYILLVVNYISRWEEVIATKINNAKVVVDFLISNIFYWFSAAKVLINDQGSLNAGSTSAQREHLSPRREAPGQTSRPGQADISDGNLA
ncbi:hypothetical protein CR513_44172, partial [Mucuna pruriens]